MSIEWAVICAVLGDFAVGVCYGRYLMRQNVERLATETALAAIAAYERKVIAQFRKDSRSPARYL